MNCAIARCIASAFLLSYPFSLGAQKSTAVSAEVQAVYAGAEALYIDLHQHPELSSHENRTASSGMRESRMPSRNVSSTNGKSDHSG